MALLDYKIVNYSHEGRHVSATVRVYRGAYQNVTEPIGNGETKTTNRYVRAAKVRERTFEYDVPRDMTRSEFITKVRAHLNKKLMEWAAANGHTVITEQQDVTAYEAGLNETEV